jgi:hypothetical protein
MKQSASWAHCAAARLKGRGRQDEHPADPGDAAMTDLAEPRPALPHEGKEGLRRIRALAPGACGSQRTHRWRERIRNFRSRGRMWLASGREQTRSGGHSYSPFEKQSIPISTSTSAQSASRRSRKAARRAIRRRSRSGGCCPFRECRRGRRASVRNRPPCSASRIVSSCCFSARMLASSASTTSGASPPTASRYPGRSQSHLIRCMHLPQIH